MASIYGIYRYVEPQLPDVTQLKDIRLQTPMLVYSAEGELIAQYGEKRRIPVKLNRINPTIIQAFLAIEDSRFYEHHGVDPVGILRAAVIAFTSGYASQGASTITQQLAKNFFLSPERTLLRKIKEVFLAMRIEKLLTKNEILELYLNKIYLGNRAYGIGAAAQVYFGKEINQLTLSELAMIAGLPKAPSTFNPLYSHERAVARRDLVLFRMFEQAYITRKQYERARNETLVASYHSPKIAFSAPYLTEMVRLEMIKRYGENADTDGYRVYTTITRKLQLAAVKSVRDNLLAYDMRHGWRGPSSILWEVGETPKDKQYIISLLKTLPSYGQLLPAVIIRADAAQATALLADANTVTLTMAGISWARPFRSDSTQGPTPEKINDVIQPGQQVWVREHEGIWWLSQVPDVNSALVAIDPNDGAIKALVGGFDFNQSKFNRVTQSLRQVGSSIKPFLYTAAFDKGLTLATIVNDLPISRWDAGAGTLWSPKNSPPTYDGPMRLRQGLGQSKNVVMVRVVRAIGVDYAANYLERFGFPAKNIMRSESLALGSPSFTPLQLVRGYAVLANGGYLVDPWFITKIEDNAGKPLFIANPKVVCTSCNLPVIYGETAKSITLVDDSMGEVAVSQKKNPEDVAAFLSEPGSVEQQYAPPVISTAVSFLIRDALNSNIFGEAGSHWMGTAWRASRDIKRRDIGGKTGTTNSSKDAWFAGYGPNLVAAVWIGFDDHRRDLGYSRISGVIPEQISGAEGGAKSAQPAWNAFMKVALEDIPEQIVTPPSDIVSVVIDKQSGKLAQNASTSRSEYFIQGTQPNELAIYSEIQPDVSTQSSQQDELF